MKPGVYPELTMSEYLRLPAVSASILRAMIQECPLAGWHASHLNAAPTAEGEDEEEVESDDTEASDRGSIAHQIFLEGSDTCCCVIDPADYLGKRGGVPRGWTNDAIKEARDNARARGLIPILKSKMPPIRAMVGVAQAYVASLRQSEPAVWHAFQPDGGASEVTLVWEDGGVLCKMRTDRLSTDRRLIINYKTTATSVEPDRWGRTQFPDYYLGGSFYRRGINALFGVEPDHVFLCQQTSDPFLCSLVGMDPASFALGDQKVTTGLRLWQQCVARNEWPSYPRRVCYPALPPWEESRWQEREIEIAGIDYERGLASQP